MIFILQVNKYTNIKIAGASLEGGGGEVVPDVFRKLEKSALIWRKNALTVVIYG